MAIFAILPTIHPQRLLLAIPGMVFQYLRYGCTLFLLFCFTAIHAQSEFISPKSLNATSQFVNCFWKTENGLPHNHVLQIYQTKDGFLWISTAYGLCRFDGQQFQLYGMPNIPSLSKDPFRFFLEDKSNCLWLLSAGNKLVRYERGHFELIAEDVNAIVENNDGKIYISRLQRIFEYKNKQLIPLYYSGDKNVEQLIAGPGNQLYLLSNTGIDLFYNGKLTAIYNKKEHDRILMHKNPDGNIYVLLNVNELFQLRHDHLELVSTFRIPVGKNQNFSSLLISNENDFWLGSDEGLLHINHQKIETLNVASGLSSNVITTVFMDDSKNIWAGTLNEGVNKLKRKTIRTYSVENGLMNDNCGPLLCLPDSSLLISNFCKGINRMKNGTFEEPVQQSGHCFYALMQDRVTGEFWGGTYGAGIHCYRNGKIVRNITPKEGLPNDKVFALFQDHENTIWIGTQAGICSFKNGKPGFSVSTAGKVCFIREDSKNRIMFCFDKGIGLIEGSSVKMFTPEDALLNGAIRHVYEDNEGTYWIATYGSGMLRFKNDAFFFFPDLIDKYASCIIEDRYERLWISTNKGIYMGKRSDLNDYADGKTVFLPVQYFGKQDGMLNEECNGGFQYAGLQLDDQHICFPTQNGVAILQPYLAEPSFHSPKFYIQSITVDTTAYSNLDSLKKISTTHQKITFHFTAPFFGDPHNLLFQYRLDGYDNNWSGPLHAREASYLNLPPGHYTFRIRIYGNLLEKKFSFKIPRPFWKTELFLYAVVAGLLYLIIGITFIQMNRKRKKEVQKNDLIQRYSRLKLSALQTQINPHFMFNCLNSIRYFIEASKKEEATIYLQKFSRLLRMFIEHSRSEFIPVQEEIKLLTLYCELERLRFNIPFDFTFNTDEQLTNGNMKMPSMIVQHFVENSITHGLKNLDRKGKLELTFSLHENTLVVKVSDDGIGRILSEQNNSQKMNGHISRGGQLTKERIELINIIKKMHITVDIQDKFPDREETGTEVTIHIPLKSETNDQNSYH